MTPVIAPRGFTIARAEDTAVTISSMKAMAATTMKDVSRVLAVTALSVWISFSASCTTSAMPAQ